MDENIAVHATQNSHCPPLWRCYVCLYWHPVLSQLTSVWVTTIHWFLFFFVFCFCFCLHNNTQQHLNVKQTVIFSDFIHWGFLTGFPDGGHGEEYGSKTRVILINLLLNNSNTSSPSLTGALLKEHKSSDHWWMPRSQVNINTINIHI